MLAGMVCDNFYGHFLDFHRVQSLGGMVRMSEGRGVKSCFGIAQIDKALCQIHANFPGYLELFSFHNILQTLVKSAKVDITFLSKPS